MEAMPQFLQPDWTNNIAQLLSAYVHAHVCIYVNHRPNIGINIYSNGIYIIICIYIYIIIYIYIYVVCICHSISTLAICQAFSAPWVSWMIWSTMTRTSSVAKIFFSNTDRWLALLWGLTVNNGGPSPVGLQACNGVHDCRIWHIYDKFEWSMMKYGY